METQELSDEENYLEKKKLAELVFEKAKSESKENAKTALANYIEDNSDLSHKTLIRFYNRYILGDMKMSIATISTLNLTSKFIGHLHFADFCKNYSLHEEIEIIEKSKNPSDTITLKPEKSYWKKILAGSGIVGTLGLGVFGFNQINQPQCMYWKDTHYMIIDCDENSPANIDIKSYDDELYRFFHQLEVSDTTTFFEAGKVRVWYLKVDGKLEFYSAPGRHPINGKTLKEVTPYIVKKYVLEK